MEFSGVNTARLAATAGLCAALLGGGVSAPAVVWAAPGSACQEVSAALDESGLDDVSAAVSDDKTLDGLPDAGGNGGGAGAGVEDAVAQVGEMPYASLSDALVAASEANGTVTLLKDVNLSAPLLIAQGSATIDLAGHVIDGSGVTSKSWAVGIGKGASLSVIDSSAGGTGKILGASGYVVLSNGNFSLKGGSLGGTSECGVFMAGEKASFAGNAPTFTMTGGSVTGKGEGIRGQFGALVHISGGTVKVTGRNPDNPRPAVVLLGSHVEVSGSARLEGEAGVSLFNLSFKASHPDTPLLDNIKDGENYPSSIKMDGGSIETSVYAITGNNGQSATCSAEISGGTLKSRDTCIYWPMEGSLTISGDSHIEGATAVEAKMGTITISGGTLVGTGTSGSNFTGNGESADGSALKLVGQLYGAGEGQCLNSPNLVANVTGGTFKSVNGNAVAVYNAGTERAYGGAELTSSATVGGSATMLPAEGKDPLRVTSAKNNFTLTDDGVKTGNTVVTNDEVAKAAAGVQGVTTVDQNNKKETTYTLYSSLNSAVAAAGDTETSITLLRDVEEDITIPENSNVTLDLGGKKLTGTVENKSDSFKVEGEGTLQGEVTGKPVELPDTVTKVVARAGDKTYSSIADALKENPAGTVVLVADVTEDVVIEGSMSVTLDLAGHALTNAKGHTITNNGKLTVVDVSEGKTGVVDNVTHGKAAVYNNAGATAVLSAGTFSRSGEASTSPDNPNGNSFYTIKNFGDMIIDRGVTVNQGADGNGHYSSLIGNGWQNGAAAGNGAEPAVANGGAKLIIKGGVFNGGLNTIKNDDYGTLVVEGGEFKNVEQAAVLNWNVAAISGGTFQSNKYAVLNGYQHQTMDRGELTITGGTFTAPTVIEKMGGSTNSGDIKISGGSFDGKVSAKLDGDTAISGGDFTSAPGGHYVGARYEVASSAGYSYFNDKTQADKKAAQTGGVVVDLENAGEGEKARVTITLDYGDGSAIRELQLVPGSVLGSPSRSGYTFLGWYNESGKKVDAVPDADAKLTARWSYNVPVVPSYSVTVEKTQGGAVKVTPASAQKGDKVTVSPAPEKGQEVRSVSVVDKDGKEIKLSLAADGTYSFIMPASKVTVKVVFGCDGGELCVSHAFVDVDQSQWYHDAIDWAVENGILLGKAGSFELRPTDSTTRAELIALMARVAGADDPRGPKARSFPDAPAGSWYSNVLDWAVENQLVSGYANGNFGPDDNLTREQLAVFLQRLASFLGNDVKAGGGLSAFPDAGKATFGADALAWAVGEGIIYGNQDGTLDPTGTANRAQVAAMLQRFCDRYDLL